MSVLSHSGLPRRGKPVPRAQIKTSAQALDYAAAGFHACVDQGNKMPTGSAAYNAWASAAASYVTAFGVAPTAIATGLGPVLNLLASADAKASAAAQMQAPTKSGAPAPLVVVNPASPVPIPEQLNPKTFLGLPPEIGGIPIWALIGLPVAIIAYKKFGPKSRGSR